MRTLFIFTFLLCAVVSNSQDHSNLEKIDSIVMVINNSKFTASKDSIIQNLPDLGLNIKTYLTMMVDTGAIVKYVNFVKTDRMEKGELQQITSSSTFYFSKNNLVKVEEMAIYDNQVQQMGWYFQEDKCIYHTLQSDKADSRSSLLISMAKGFSKIIHKGN